MTDLESLGLSPDQIEQTKRVACEFTITGQPPDLSDLAARFAPVPVTKRLDETRRIMQGKLRLNRPSLLTRLRRLLWAIYGNSGEMVDPASYGYKGQVSTHNH